MSEPLTSDVKFEYGLEHDGIAVEEVLVALLHEHVAKS